MKNIAQYNAPFVGKGNVFNLGHWWQLVLGMAVLMIAYAFAKPLAGRVQNRIPFARPAVAVNGAPSEAEFV